MVERLKDLIALKPSDALEFLIQCIRDRENVALVGAPGIGKSSLGYQAAEITKNDLVVSLPSTEDVTEPGGFPWIAPDHSYAIKVLFGQAYKVVNSKRPTVWFWEDFGQANQSVQAAYMQWAWAREVNGHKLPDHVTIIAATNRRTDMANVGGWLEPVKGRFTMVEVVSNVDDFCADLIKRGKSHYGLDDETINFGCAFIRLRPELLNKFEPTKDMTNSPTERNWVASFRHMQRRMKPAIELAAVAGRVGQGPASELIGTWRIMRDMPSLDAILADPDSAPVPEDPSVLYAVAVGLAGKATEANFGRVGRYAERLRGHRCDVHKGGLGDIGVLLIRDSIRRHNVEKIVNGRKTTTNKLANTAAFIEIMTSPIGKLISGQMEPDGE